MPADRTSTSGVRTTFPAVRCHLLLRGNSIGLMVIQKFDEFRYRCYDKNGRSRNEEPGRML